MMETIIDTNINLSRWPTRRIPEDELSHLVAKLHKFGVTEAWASSLDGLLHKDITSVNQRLVSECRSQSKVTLHPFGVINPMLPGWEEDLRRCVQDHHMQGIRLFPNYHGYRLDDPIFVHVLQEATKNHLIVSLAVQMEDERMMHPLLRVKPVVLDPLGNAFEMVKDLRLVLHNANQAIRKNSLIRDLARSKQLFIDIALLDGLGIVDEVLKDIPYDKLLFGSHAPMLYFESAILKLEEANVEHFRKQAILRQNASKLFAFERLEAKR